MKDLDPPSKPKRQYGDVPAELSFEEVIRNRTAPPCSLNDFMDYLFYVERNAEPLQFFLWYLDYMQRWSRLLPRQKALSPPWDPEQAAEPRSRFIKYSHKRERSLKMSKVISIMEMDSELSLAESLSPSPLPSPTAGNSPSPPTAALLSPTDLPKKDWQPFTIQPLRPELDRITRHYLHPQSAPRLLLPLSSRDRAACLRAAQHTTHPSALLPALAAAEATLRARSHPGFARWARRNASAARVRFLRGLGAGLVLLGVAADVALVLARASLFWRAACAALWWPGLAVLVAAGRGVCLVLFWKGRRQVRPWEAAGGEEGVEEEEEEGEVRRGGEVGWRKEHKRADTAESVGSAAGGGGGGVGGGGADPLRKPSLQVFGPRNEYGGEAWVAGYREKGWVKKVFDETVVVQSQALVMWQDRTVFFALLWGGVGAAALTVVSLFLPSAMLF